MVFPLMLIEFIGLDFLNGISSSSCHIFAVFLAMFFNGFKLLNLFASDSLLLVDIDLWYLSLIFYT